MKYLGHQTWWQCPEGLGVTSAAKGTPAWMDQALGGGAQGRRVRGEGGREEAPAPDSDETVLSLTDGTSFCSPRLLPTTARNQQPTLQNTRVPTQHLRQGGVRWVGVRTTRRGRSPAPPTPDGGSAWGCNCPAVPSSVRVELCVQPRGAVHTSAMGPGEELSRASGNPHTKPGSSHSVNQSRGRLLASFWFH